MGTVGYADHVVVAAVHQREGVHPALGDEEFGLSQGGVDVPRYQFAVALLEQSPVPASYATAPYYAVHTFYFTNAQGTRQPARWIAEPAAGRVGLTAEEAKALAPDFLQAELGQRAAGGPVAWDLYLQLPEPGDPLTDASAAWPAERKKVKVARLELTSVDAPGTKGPCDQVMFEPTSVPEGIETSDDPVLLIRPAAYAVSFSRRMEQ